MISITRHHDVDIGHRVYGHEGKCKHLHGHSYRIHFTCCADKLDSLGRVIDFSVIKSKLCQWLEDNWDHRTILWEKDPIAYELIWKDRTPLGEWELDLIRSIVPVPFNPTAENMAAYLLETVGPQQLTATDVTLVDVVVEETRKCSAHASLDPRYSRKPS